LDLGSRLPFRIKNGPVNLAITRGMYFEIRYAPAIRDQNSRKNLIANAMALVKVTKGKNLILTSEAAAALEIRAPHDIVNL
jgi:ribonuclease P/MRP protein subunit RPP1